MLNDAIGRNYRAGRCGTASERGEAARDAVEIFVIADEAIGGGAGLPTEWVDGVPSESERVAGAVEYPEGEMRAAPLRANAPTG